MSLPLAIVHGVYRCQRRSGQVEPINAFGLISNVATKTLDLIKSAGLGDSKGPFELEDGKKFHGALEKRFKGRWRLEIYTDQGRPKFRWGAKKAANKIKILAYPKGGVYEAMLIRWDGFHRRNSACTKCSKSIFDGEHKKCTKPKCPWCKVVGCKNRNREGIEYNSPPMEFFCAYCYRFLKSRGCFDRHRKKGWKEPMSACKKQRQRRMNHRCTCSPCGSDGCATCSACQRRKVMLKAEPDCEPEETHGFLTTELFGKLTLEK